MAKSKEEAQQKKCRGNDKDGKKDDTHSKRKKWLKNYMKKPGGIKHIMDLMASVEAKSASMIASMSSTHPTETNNVPNRSVTIGSTTTADPADVSTDPAHVSSITSKYPATSTRLQSILKRK